MSPTRPVISARPANPRFSSGPCAKVPGFTLDQLADAPLGRSHRAAVGKAKLKQAIDLTRDILGVPADYRIGIVPGSDTGAVEMAMWSLLGARPVEMLAWESFGEGWVTEAPDFTFKLTANPNNRAIEFKVTSKCDSVLLINTPTSKWQFDDDSNGALDPKIRIAAATTGYYDIWIGNVEKGYCDATLKVETF